MTTMHKSTFDYLQPSEAQIELMSKLREAAKQYGEILEHLLADGPDKTFTIRSHRTTAMWANICATRLPDGSPRSDYSGLLFGGVADSIYALVGIQLRSNPSRKEIPDE